MELKINQTQIPIDFENLRKQEKEKTAILGLPEQLMNLCRAWISPTFFQCRCKVFGRNTAKTLHLIPCEIVIIHNDEWSKESGGSFFLILTQITRRFLFSISLYSINCINMSCSGSPILFGGAKFIHNNLFRYSKRMEWNSR